jgi:hypothetical protein
MRSGSWFWEARAEHLINLLNVTRASEKKHGQWNQEKESGRNVDTN